MSFIFEAHMIKNTTEILRNTKKNPHFLTQLNVIGKNRYLKQKPYFSAISGLTKRRITTVVIWYCSMFLSFKYEILITFLLYLCYYLIITISQYIYIYIYNLTNPIKSILYTKSFCQPFNTTRYH